MVAGLDTDAFNSCFNDRTHEDDVTNSYADGSALGVNRTPTLMINGELVQYAGIDDLRLRLDTIIDAP